MRQTLGAAEKLFVDFAGDTVPISIGARLLAVSLRDVIPSGAPSCAQRRNGGDVTGGSFQSKPVCARPHATF
jgi:hypothetical protein